MWTTTKAKLQRNIESMITRRTGQSALSYVEKIIVADAINTAMVDLCTQVGLDQLKPRLEDITATTTASTNYVDLDDEVLSIVGGTVRIEAEDTRLSDMELADFYAIDPGEDSEGTPTLYSLSYSGTTPRLMLRDTPDAVYTIALTVKKIVDEDEIDAFPGWFHPLLSSWATMLSFEDLNLDPSIHRRRQRERLQAVKHTIDGHQGPKHIRQIRHRSPIRDIENYRQT